MSFDFTKFNKVIEEKKIETVSDNFGENYTYMVIANRLSVSEIDFSLFDIEDITQAHNELEHAITDEQLDGEVYLDPNHPFTRVIALGNKISTLEKLPKVRPASPYRFL
ncbi:hypothetical protein [Bacillus cihuensis]|uniref:hypothetical protein n=1 Tax=Bacillus cihuensis TaxID=1208599 RepID=UPI0004146340|nr:hypothetical protein [Bacillus cihuensis]